MSEKKYDAEVYFAAVVAVVVVVVHHVKFYPFRSRLFQESQNRSLKQAVSCKSSKEKAPFNRKKPSLGPESQVCSQTLHFFSDIPLTFKGVALISFGPRRLTTLHQAPERWCCLPRCGISAHQRCCSADLETASSPVLSVLSGGLKNKNKNKKKTDGKSGRATKNGEMKFSTGGFRYLLSGKQLG